MNCPWNISFMLGSPMQKFLPVANWKSSSCSPLSLPPAPKKGFDSRGVVRPSPLLHAAGSLQQTVNVLVDKGVPGSNEDSWGRKEEKDRDQTGSQRRSPTTRYHEEWGARGLQGKQARAPELQRDRWFLWPPPAVGGPGPQGLKSTWVYSG